MSITRFPFCNYINQFIHEVEIIITKRNIYILLWNILSSNRMIDKLNLYPFFLYFDSFQSFIFYGLTFNAQEIWHKGGYLPFDSLTVWISPTAGLVLAFGNPLTSQGDHHPPSLVAISYPLSPCGNFITACLVYDIIEMTLIINV